VSNIKHGTESQAAGGKTNVNQEHGNVEVRWMFTPDLNGPHTATMEAQPGVFREVRGRHTYSVLVRSKRLPHSKLVGEIAPEDVTSLPKIRRHVGILAGALAEEVNVRFKDNIDPSEIAKAAVEAFAEMAAEQKNALLQSTA
jgi:hypothetical protein